MPEMAVTLVEGGLESRNKYVEFIKEKVFGVEGKSKISY